MPSIKTITFALGALALAGTSQGFSLKFWEEKYSCANQYADSTRTRTPRLTVKCDSVLLGTQTVVIQDWDAKCRLIFWPEFSPCMAIGDDPAYQPIYNSSLSEAREQQTAIFDDETDRACFQDLFDNINVGAYSYICAGDDGDSDE
ncbi:hypothetical protein GQX73_g8894 [Xylaria multiplex]|uniref:Uncharacterized protein n=1 Tax=Xylaria multiplex TaxID=323545 RepID=A0A7C8MM66_9PEZI|nr:hypothetical protein GQX73_g8894 [Xylaria multiplex]